VRVEHAGISSRLDERLSDMQSTALCPPAEKRKAENENMG